MKIIVGNSSIDIGKKIVALLKVQKVQATIASFLDGECRIEIDENLNQKDTVFIIQSLSSAQFIMELLLIIDALKRIGVRNIIPVIPYLGYLRQDRRVHKGMPIGAKVMANLLESTGIQELIVLDVHFLQFEGLFNIPVHHLSAIKLFEAYILENKLLKESVLVAPDLGALKMVEKMAISLDMPIVGMTKKRTAEHIEIRHVMGDVRGKNCFIVDDILSGGNTLCNTATMLKKLKSNAVYACITHAVFFSNLFDQVIHKIKNAAIEQLIVTDSIACSATQSNIVIVSTAALFAAKIQELYARTR